MLITWEKTGARCAAPRLARSGAGNQESGGLTAWTKTMMIHHKTVPRTTLD